MIVAGFEARWRELRYAVDAIAENAGRKGSGVRVLAVSKTFPAEAVQEAYACGVRMFGENKVQELEWKVPALPSDIEWHLIGHLQRNKAAKAVRLARWIHSVDSVKLLEKLDRCAGEAGVRPCILLEVNSGEEAKSGVSYEDLDELALAAHQAEHLDWRGLMTMAPIADDPAVCFAAFEKLALARTALEKKFGIVLPELSMGMTGDYPEAVRAGATIIRVGTFLFGHRDYGTGSN